MDPMRRLPPNKLEAKGQALNERFQLVLLDSV
jgi:hypothetical protein